MKRGFTKLTRWPTGSRCGQARFAKVRLTIITLGASALSESRKKRPAASGTPRAWKKSGVTERPTFTVGSSASGRVSPCGRTLTGGPAPATSGFIGKLEADAAGQHAGDFMHRGRGVDARRCAATPGWDSG